MQCGEAGEDYDAGPQGDYGREIEDDGKADSSWALGV